VILLPWGSRVAAGMEVFVDQQEEEEEEAEVGEAEV
jgi:hypothetical protein